MEQLKEAKIKIKCYIECQRGDLALKILKKVLEYTPNDPELNHFMGVVPSIVDQYQPSVEPLGEFKLLFIIIEGHHGGSALKVLDGMENFYSKNDREYKCPKCQSVSNSAHGLLQHFLDKHPVFPKSDPKVTLLPFRCPVEICGLGFPHKYQLQQHISKMHNGGSGDPFLFEFLNQLRRFEN